MKYNLIAERLTLVVDLDGTFLASPVKFGDRLYRFIEANRDRITLIFATGRALESVLSVISNPRIPNPDYVIGDVGASVAHGSTFEPIFEIQSRINASWPGSTKILELTSEFESLRLQTVPQERRCSFLIEENGLDIKALEAKVVELGCEVLVSVDKYLDVLPAGVSKGATVLELLALKKIDKATTMVAGDTMNDFSMFATGLASAIVGKTEPQLLERTSKMDNCHISLRDGTLGILDALLHFKLIQEEPLKINTDVVYGPSELVMVYHRQPFDEIRKGKEVIRKTPQSPNGIIPTLLSFFSREKPGAWIAWSLHNSPNEKFETHVKFEPDRYPGLVTSRVPLSTEDVNLFYKKFSKEAFWPIIFSFPEKVMINHSHWEHFKKINQLFAEQTAREAAHNALVWIHDYNLWLVPGILRQLRPDVRIAFFHHTSFPTPDIFNILPWRNEIIGSLIQCDHIGFHIPRYVENFIDVVRSTFKIEVLESTSCAPKFLTYGCALGVDSFVSKISVESRSLTIGAHPVGIDIARVRDSYTNQNVVESITQLEEEIKGRKVILSVERLDYVKGPIEKIEAFEELLDKHPELHEKIILINIVTPPAPGMDVYRQTREKLDQAVGRINGRFAKLSWTPIRYFYKSFLFEDLMALYAISDIAWITPLRDGLNLVCKEYIAVKDIAKRPGTLILSEFAGASVEMHGALLTNPYDKRDLVQVLNKAINMSDEERASRQERLSSIVRVNDVNAWGKSFLKSAHP